LNSETLNRWRSAPTNFFTNTKILIFNGEKGGVNVEIGLINGCKFGVYGRRQFR